LYQKIIASDADHWEPDKSVTVAKRLSAGRDFPCLQNTQLGSGIENPPVVDTGSASPSGKWPGCGDAHWVRND